MEKAPFLEFFIFDATGKLLFFYDFVTLNQENNDFLKRLQGDKDFINRAKNTFGLTYTMQAICEKLSDKTADKGKCVFHDICTNQYKLSYYCTLTDLRFIVTSHPDSRDFSKLLKSVYNDIYIPYVARNVFYQINDPILHPLFKEKLKAYLFS